MKDDVQIKKKKKTVLNDGQEKEGNDTLKMSKIRGCQKVQAKMIARNIDMIRAKTETAEIEPAQNE